MDNRSLSKGGILDLEGLVVIAGPCVIESREQTLETAKELKQICSEFGLSLVFKSSFDKANRTSADSYRGLGIEEGLSILAEVKRELSLPLVTDVHDVSQVKQVAEVVDIIQIPAFLCRQTDLLFAAGDTGKHVMVKKGQFLHPEDMKYAAEKIESRGNSSISFCERGSTFGYRELVVDFRSLKLMRALGYPVVFDGTHSVQVMGGAGGKSSGNRDYVSALTRAAIAIGVDAIFLECHRDPDNAPSDGANMLPLKQLPDLLGDIVQLHNLNLKTRS